MGKIILAIIFSFFVGNANAQRVKLRYGVGIYCADSSRAGVSCFQLDSLRLEIQYYKDLLEEEKRKNYILVNGSRFLSVTSQQVKGRMEFNESYYTASGLLFYNSSAWIDKGDTTWVDRKRYDYDENGIMTKAVHEYFISAEHLVQRFINTTGKAIDINKGPERSKLKLEKIKAYEFWD